jgi:ACR3 family arsenite efflux pump ArsB
VNLTAFAVFLTIWFVFALILGIAVGRLLDGSSSEQEDVDEF